jgi:hypothetical protein
MPSFTAYELILACAKPGCPVCRLEQKAVQQYMDGLLYESVNSPATRDRLRQSHGFCNEHAWFAVEAHLGDALGFAIIYHDVINSVLRRLEAGVEARPAGRWAALLERLPLGVRGTVQNALYALTTWKRCPACQQRDDALDLILTELFKSLAAPETAQALRSSAGLCFPHLRLALQQAPDAQACETLIDVHRSALESMRAELAELIRKNDYRFNKEKLGKEGDAWSRAVGMVIGNKREKT